MTLRNKNEFVLFKAQIENNDVLSASNCRQATIFKNGKIFILENKSYSDVVAILEKENFEIVNIY